MSMIRANDFGNLKKDSEHVEYKNVQNEISTLKPDNKYIEFLTPVSKGKARCRTKSCESSVRLQNETMLECLKKFENAEKNFSIEKLKRSASNYDKLNKFNSKKVSKKLCVDDIRADEATVAPISQTSSSVEKILKIESNGLDKYTINNSDTSIAWNIHEKFQERREHDHTYTFNSKFRAFRPNGSYWEFLISMTHDKRLHLFTQPMNWIKVHGEIQLYEGKFKILSRKCVICNFSVETPFIPGVPTNFSSTWSSAPSRDETRQECYDVTLNDPNRRFWIDPSIRYNFQVSDENLFNFNLILLVIPNPVVLDVCRENFNNGWKMITIVVPPLNLGVQNTCNYVHEVPFPDRMYNKNGGYQPWWSYQFQILWECNSKKKSFAAWNAVIEFVNPFQQMPTDGLEAKILISSASLHFREDSHLLFLPRPSFCNNDSFTNGTSLNIIKDIFLPKSIRCRGPCMIQVPNFSYFIALPRVNDSTV